VTEEQVLRSAVNAIASAIDEMAMFIPREDLRPIEIAVLEVLAKQGDHAETP
jgi:hypothetical protein